MLSALTREIWGRHDSINGSSFPFPLQLWIIALFTQSCDDHIMKTSEKLNHIMNNMSKSHSILRLWSRNRFSTRNIRHSVPEQLLTTIKWCKRRHCKLGWFKRSQRFNQTHDQCKVWATLFPHSTERGVVSCWATLAFVTSSRGIWSGLGL